MEIYKALSEAISRVFIYTRLSKSQEVKMSDKFQLKRGIYEPSSDIAKLCAEILEIKAEDA